MRSLSDGGGVGLLSDDELRNAAAFCREQAWIQRGMVMLVEMSLDRIVLLGCRGSEVRGCLGESESLMCQQ